MDYTVVYKLQQPSRAWAGLLSGDLRLLMLEGLDIATLHYRTLALSTVFKNYQTLFPNPKIISKHYVQSAALIGTPNARAIT